LANIKQKLTKNITPSPAREAYTSPVLKEFGQVGALTQAGSGLIAEMGMEIPMMGMLGMMPALDKARP
jgi:hypothetical protein